MRIVVNNIAASSGGALTILKSFHNYLVNSKDAKEHEWIFLLSDKYIEETDNIKVIILDKVKRSWKNRLIFDLYSGKKFISSLNPDVIFSMQNTIIFGVECPQVLYMHQSIPFQNVKRYSFLKKEERVLAVYQFIIGRLIKESVKRAATTVVQTKWIRNAVIENTGISPNRIVDIFPPLEDYSKYKSHNLTKKGCFFYPANASNHKNHSCIIQACRILNENGIEDYKVDLTIDGENTRNIDYLGSIPFEIVMEKYNTSTLIFPSFIESIGLPLFEARQMGAIILASDCPFSREVLEQYGNAYFFNPFNASELANLMEKVIMGEIVKINDMKTGLNPIGGWDMVVDTIFNEVE